MTEAEQGPATAVEPETGAGNPSVEYLKDRILFPIVVPVAAMAILGFAVLNLSRVLLASSGSGEHHSNKPVVVASLVGILIVAGAVWATSRDRVSRSAIFGGAALVGLLLVPVGLVAQEVDEENVAAGQEHPVDVAGSITVVAVDVNEFETDELVAPPGNVEVTLDNRASATHNFVVEGREDETKVEAAGASTNSGFVEFPETGEFTFYCDIPGHRAAGMEGTLTVEEGAAAGGGGAAAGGQPVTVEAVDIDFPQKEFEAAAGEVTFEYVNTGAAPHTLVVEGRESDMKIEAQDGETQTGSIQLDAGEYVLYCDIPGHRSAGMEGTITVTEGGGGGAAPEGGGGEPPPDEGGGGEAPDEEQGDAEAGQGSGGEETPAPDEDAAGGGAVHVVAEDIDFPETDFDAAAGEVTFEYENVGAIVHTLVVEGREDDMKIEAQGGETQTGTIELDAGEYTIYCDIPGHRSAGMEGTVTVS